MAAAADGEGVVTPGRVGAKAWLRWAFLGPNGIRAGWSALIFVAIFLAIATAVGFAYRLAFGKPAQPKGELPAQLLLIREVVFLAVTLAATAIMGWIEGKSVWYYGLAGPRKVIDTVAGAAGGLFCMSALVAALALSGFLVFDSQALHGLPILGYGLAWLLVFLLVGMFEETLFRGYLQTTLTRGIGFWPAAIVLSLLFGAGHLANHGETAWGIVQVVVAGLILCALLRFSGSLWLPIGFHMAWDWAQSYLFGVADSGLMMKGHLFVTHAVGNANVSGGSTGPEGSMLAGPISVAGVAGMLYLLRRAGLLGIPAAPLQA
jgi:membrane protease YdiL (CAAX protease family)